MANVAEAKIDTPCSAYGSMRVPWDMVDALDGGTRAMQAAGELYLPREKEELIEHYEIRLGRTILYEAYRDTIDAIAAKPFSKDVSLKNAENLPEALRAIETNADREGTPLTSFSSDVFRAGVHHGLCHVLIDHPPATEQRSLSDDRTLEVRPYLQLIESTRLIGWRTTNDQTGRPILDSIRIKEDHTEPDGKWGEKDVSRIRVYTRDGWQVHVKRGGMEDYTIESEGTHHLGVVPLVTFYANRLGFMQAAPAMEALAWLNVQHWQSQSDQRQILTFARMPLLFGAGWADDDRKAFKLAPRAFNAHPNPNAKLMYVEHQGVAINAGRQDLHDIEARMEIMGLKPMVERSARSTATGKRIDDDQAQSAIKAWVQSLERALESAYKIAGRWVKADLPDDFSVDVFDDFAVLGERSFDELQYLLKLRLAGQISHKRFLAETKRRQVFDHDFDVDAEIEEAEASIIVPEFTEPDDRETGDDGA